MVRQGPTKPGRDYPGRQGRGSQRKAPTLAIRKTLKAPTRQSGPEWLVRRLPTDKAHR
jgi:hypothetical protein